MERDRVTAAVGAAVDVALDLALRAGDIRHLARVWEHVSQGQAPSLGLAPSCRARGAFGWLQEA